MQQWVRSAYERVRNRLKKIVSGGRKGSGFSAGQEISSASAAPVPISGEREFKLPFRLLLIAWFDPHGINTVIENSYQLCTLSRFNFDLINLYGASAVNGLELPSSLDLRNYDGIIIHCTVSYNVDNLLSLDRRLNVPIREYSGVKVLVKQDEQYRTNRIVDYLVSCNFQLLLTCVAPSEIEKVYPKEKIRNLRFLHTLTGYVSDKMRGLSFKQTDLRPTDIGYRGSLQPFYFGRLSFEKRYIGELFQRICQDRGLSQDISNRWEDRFNGSEWLQFLGQIKGVLGVESGASIFDFDGSLEDRTSEFLKKNTDADFEAVFEAILKPYEGNVHYNQISPRHFEAAACRTVQILYEGDYSDVFHAGRHYLSLKRDLSNLDETLERFQDEGERVRMTDAAFEEIIMSDRYTYKSFVKCFDDTLQEMLEQGWRNRFRHTST